MTARSASMSVCDIEATAIDAAEKSDADANVTAAGGVVAGFECFRLAL